MSNSSVSNPFIDYLSKLKDNKAAMAILRRGIAYPPGEYIPQFNYIIPFLPEHGKELPYFLTASLFALHPENTDDGNFGTSFKALDSTPGIELRFKALLQCREEELPVHLRGAISLLASKAIKVNYTELFQAINHWEHQEKFIQKRWAKSFWVQQEQTNNQ